MEQAAGTAEQVEARAELARRADDLRRRVTEAAGRVGRQPDEIGIIAVSKTVPLEMLYLAYELGFTVFGENRVQEALTKNSAWGRGAVRWELIGHLQSNKAARAVDLFARIQSLDSLHLAETLHTRAAQRGRMLPVLLEVNVAEEATKTGFAPSEVRTVARALAAYPSLRLDGLMTVAPLVEDAEQVRPVFRRLRELRDELRDSSMNDEAGPLWTHLSMGMTDDFEVAIEEGATLIRIGRGLFGDRPPVARVSAG